MKRMLRDFAVACVLSLCTSALALAGSVTQPGETLGAPAGAPAPPGFYFADTVNWGCRNTKPQDTCVGVNIPVFVWSTPWTVLGARLQLTAPGPISVEVGAHNTNYFSGLFNPFASAELAWDLSGGWGFSYMLGAYMDANSPVAYSTGSLNQRFALSYTANGWNLTANVIWGIQFDQVTDRPQTSPCPVSPGRPSNGCNPNFMNVDLTATKKFGKWEVGPVAYYSSDLSTPVPGYQKQSQFAVGGLIGYWFGPVILQGYVTSDVYENNYGGKDVRGWARIAFPLGNPFGPAPVAVPVAH
jgi:Putative MetA-pathway of phenol degradation